MRNKFVSFWQLVFFEFKKLLRSPIILSFLIIGPLSMQIFLGFVIEKNNLTRDNFNFQENICFVQNGEVDEEVTDALNYVVSKEEINWTTGFDDAILKLKLQKVLMVLSVDTQKNPQEITIYYDSSNALSREFQKNTEKLQQKYAYLAVVDFLDEYFSITIDEKYFNSTQYENLVSEKNPFTISFPSFLSVFLAFVVMIGISYSVARDNETQVVAHIRYMPLSVNKYLLVKGTLYLILGIFNFFLLMFGGLIFHLTIAGSIFELSLFVVVFLMSFIAMNMLFSTSKNQISSISLSLLFILVPVIIGMMLSLNSLPVVLQTILLLSPLTSFLEVCRSFVLYGVFDYLYLIIMLVEMIIFYVLAVLIFKHKKV